jgi:hypothetical protein
MSDEADPLEGIPLPVFDTADLLRVGWRVGNDIADGTPTIGVQCPHGCVYALKMPKGAHIIVGTDEQFHFDGVNFIGTAPADIAPIPKDIA